MLHTTTQNFVFFFFFTHCKMKFKNKYYPIMKREEVLLKLKTVSNSSPFIFHFKNKRGRIGEQAKVHSTLLNFSEEVLKTKIKSIKTIDNKYFFIKLKCLIVKGNTY